MKSIVLAVDALGKRYSSYRTNMSRFAQWFGFSPQTESEYWAVRGASFSVASGEAVAIIGSNGAGKSTLLKLITGTTRPTTGYVRFSGRVSALLELGIGFNPDLTGRQNAFLAGGLMGISYRRLEDLMPEIEEFAEIGEFFDQPLRIYSSGMQARLAFAVATAQRPDLLIVDEVLSVGDSYFQHKSFERIRQFKALGSTILFVSHSMGDVKSLCDRVVLLDRGSIIRDGLPDEVVDYYCALVAEKENAQLTIEQRRKKDGWLTTRSGTKEVVLDSLRLIDSLSNAEIRAVKVGQRVAIVCTTTVNRPVPRLVLGLLITDRSGHKVWGTNTWHTRQVLENLAPGARAEFRFEFDCNLGPGSYGITYNLVSTDTRHVNNFDSVDNHLVFDVINSDRPYFVGTACLNANIEARFLLNDQS